MVCRDVAHLMFVEAAPVNSTLRPPFVVSADRAITQADAPDVAYSLLIIDTPKTVLAALASLSNVPLTSQLA